MKRKVKARLVAFERSGDRLVMTPDP